MQETFYLPMFGWKVVEKSRGLDSAPQTDLYTSAKAVQDFPLRRCQTSHAHRLQLGLAQLPVHLHRSLKVQQQQQDA